MAIDLSKSVQAFIEGREARRRGSQNQIDDAVKMAQLSELGYDYNPSTRALMQRPDYVSLKGLQKQELMNKLDPNYEANRAANKEKALIAARREAMFGQPGLPSGQGDSGTFGAMPGLVGGKLDTESPFVYDPITGTQKQNPAYLNPLAKEKLAQIAAKKQEDIQAQKNKEDMIRLDAESQLQAIQESKKGKKYFGAMGNLPTSAAPSTYLSFGAEYGPRKVWENNTNKLLSGRIIDLMNKMKSASKTGATGFGQLNRSELQLIQNASNVLSKDLTPDDAEKYLNQLEGVYNKILGKGGNQTFGQGGQQAQTGDPLEAEAQAAISAGADPKAVMEKLAQLRGQRN